MKVLLQRNCSSSPEHDIKQTYARRSVYQMYHKQCFKKREDPTPTMLLIQCQKVKATASNFPRVPSGNKTDFDFCMPRIRPWGGGTYFSPTQP